MRRFLFSLLMLTALSACDYSTGYASGDAASYGVADAGSSGSSGY